jgi:hypothetical protein
MLESIVLQGAIGIVEADEGHGLGEVRTPDAIAVVGWSRRGQARQRCAAWGNYGSIDVSGSVTWRADTINLSAWPRLQNAASEVADSQPRWLPGAAQ